MQGLLGLERGGDVCVVDEGGSLAAHQSYRFKFAKGREERTCHLPRQVLGHVGHVEVARGALPDGGDEIARHRAHLGVHECELLAAEHDLAVAAHHQKEGTLRLHKVDEGLPALAEQLDRLEIAVGADRIEELEKSISNMQEDLDILYRLRLAGVDNWDGYDFAMEGKYD